MSKEYLKPDINALEIVRLPADQNTEIGVGSGDLPEVEEDW